MRPLLVLTIVLAASRGLLASDLPPNWYAIKGAQADSAWSLEPWSLEIAYKSGISFGDLWSEEQDMADDLDLKVKQYGQEHDAMIMLQNLGLSAGLWHQVAPTIDVGLEWTHRWTLESASDQGAGLLLSSDAFMLQGRWFPLRRLVWELGPQIGVGYATGTLSRYPVLQDATFSGAGSDGTEYWLSVANEDLDVSGVRLEVGGALEIRVAHWCSVGGTLLLGRTGWSVDGDDPMDLTTLGYPKDLAEYDVEVEVHGAYRF